MIRSARSMTWWLVRMLPSASMMKPLPAPRRGASRSRGRRIGRAVERIGRLGQPRPAAPARAIAPARRRVDVHDRRVQALDDVGEIDERWRDAGAARATRAGRRRGRVAGPPATIADRAIAARDRSRPTRNATIAVSADGDDGEAARHRAAVQPLTRSIISARNCCLIQQSTPSCRAFSSLAAGLRAGDHAVRLLADRSGDLARRAARALRSPPRASSTPACRSGRTTLPASGPGVAAPARGAWLSMLTPAASSRSISARLRGSSANARTDAATHRADLRHRLQRLDAARRAARSIVRKCRASVAAAFSPTWRMPSA